MMTENMDMLNADLSRSMSRRLSDLSHQLNTLTKRVRHPGHALKQQQAALARLNSALYRGTRRQLKAYRSQAGQLGSRLNAQHPRQQLSRQQGLCQQLGHQLQRHIHRHLQATRGELNHQIKLLASLGPEQTLHRGYAIVTNEQGKVVKRAESASKGDALRIRLGRGLLAAEVKGHPER